MGVCGVVIAIVLLRTLFPGAFTAVLAPVLRTGASLTTLLTPLRTAFADTAALARELDQLRMQNGALTNENIALSAKVDDLTRLLGSEPGETLGIVVGVLARPPVTGYDTLLVAAGTLSGVSSGMRAIAEGGVPVGTVQSVTQNYARITLHSAPGQELSAWVGQERLAINLIGKGAGTFGATIAKGAGIVEGDVVYIAGPGALPVGIVARVYTDASSPIATLSIVPSVNPFSIVWVKLVP